MIKSALESSRYQEHVAEELGVAQRTRKWLSDLVTKARSGFKLLSGTTGDP
jgi:hypothetical protein